MACYWLTILALCYLSLTAQTANVVRFSMETVEEESLVVRGGKTEPDRFLPGRYVTGESQKPKRLGTFQWKNCTDTSKDQFVMKQLSILPDPVYIPGNVSVNFSGTFFKTVDAPLQAEVTLEKNVFGTWLKVPCVDNVGSCTYSDLCSILSGITCPPSFVEQKVPCKCPFNQGSYTLTKAGVAIDVYGSVPVGDYRATANLTVNGEIIGCYSIAASIAD